MNATSQGHSYLSRRRLLWVVAGIFALTAAAVWYFVVIRSTTCAACAMPQLARWDRLEPGVAALMDSPTFSYSPGWTVTQAGADPGQPPQPFNEPSGVVTFTYRGKDLYLLLAPGDYWAYLYATIDGRPANQLPIIAGNKDSNAVMAGYKTLLEPERAANGQTPRWVQIDRAASGGEPHTARIEFWRGWEQTPLRGVAVDLSATAHLDPVSGAQANPAARWPPVLLVILGGWALAIAVWPTGRQVSVDEHAARPTPSTHSVRALLERVDRRLKPVGLALLTALVGFGLVCAGTAGHLWWLCGAGIVLLAVAGTARPALWLSALLFGLPFAYGVKLPLLPSRAVSLVDLGVLGGIVILLGAWLLQAALAQQRPSLSQAPATPSRGFALPANAPLLLLALLASWALVTVYAARYQDLALREWRTVFLNAAVFGALLYAACNITRNRGADRRLLVFSWLAGAAVVAVLGLWGYLVGGETVSTAEGVRRIQGLYDSANNLALYLDRTVAVSLALLMFLRDWRERLIWVVLAAPQLLAWVLSFSKGSLVLAAPVMLIVLLCGGVWLLRQEQRSLTPLLVIGALIVAGAILIIPFMGTERFQRLFDVGQGTGFLRLQLWRSAWQMALDHTWLGVGPDNFLYYYRGDYLLPAAWQEPNLNHPHNFFLDLWTRLGLPGLVLGLGWLTTGLLLIWRWLREGAEKALALGCLAACAAALVHGLIDVSYALPDLVLVWAFLFTLPYYAQTPQS